jgi:hypothetical protein
MSGSSDSSGGKIISSTEVEDLKKIVRELSQLDQLRAGRGSRKYANHYSCLVVRAQTASRARVTDEKSKTYEVRRTASKAVSFMVKNYRIVIK